MTTTTLAWHNNPALKDDAVARMREHRKQDDITQGVYADILGNDAPKLRACFHGCLTLETVAAERGFSIQDAINFDLIDGGASYHQHAERLWGIPQSLGALLDVFFEGVNRAYAGEWAVAVTEAIPVGADLSMVTACMIRDLLVDDVHGIRRQTVEGSTQRSVVNAVVNLYERLLAGEVIKCEEWKAASAAAYAAYGTGRIVDTPRWMAYAAYAAANVADIGRVVRTGYAGVIIDDIMDVVAAADAIAAATVTNTTHRRWRADRLLTHLRNAPLGDVDRYTGS